MRIHELKCWPEPFEALRDGRKRFELRRNDRGFDLGDRLLLEEWNPATRQHTGRKIGATISYVTRVKDWAPDAPADLVVLGLVDVC